LFQTSQSDYDSVDIKILHLMAYCFSNLHLYGQHASTVVCYSILAADHILHIHIYARFQSVLGVIEECLHENL
jgi:hypothetical protein